MKNALTVLPDIQRRLSRGDKLLLFLDFDGTLSPIVADPKRAKLSNSMREIVSRSAKRFPTFLVSGRELNDLIGRARIEGAHYAGNHGMEWRVGRERSEFTVPTKTIRSLRRALSLARTFERIPGVYVEDKRLSFAFHYRMVKESDKQRVIADFVAAMAPLLSSREVDILPQKQVLDVRPRVAHKGDFIGRIMSHERDAFAIYIGDDTTDEDAFKALRSRDYSIRMGGAPYSSARYYLDSRAELEKFLSTLAASVDDRKLKR